MATSWQMLLRAQSPLLSSSRSASIASAVVTTTVCRRMPRIQESVFTSPSSSAYASSTAAPTTSAENGRFFCRQ